MMMLWCIFIILCGFSTVQGQGEHSEVNVNSRKSKEPFHLSDKYSMQKMTMLLNENEINSLHCGS